MEEVVPASPMVLADWYYGIYCQGPGVSVCTASSETSICAYGTKFLDIYTGLVQVLAIMRTFS
jgi:hypothetical protein